MNRISLFSSALFLAANFSTSMAFASGFALYDFSAREIGTALAGDASSPEDVSTIYTNPAGLPSIGQRQLSAGFSYISPQTKISDAAGTLGGSNRGDMTDATAVPFFYAATPIDDRVAIGMGIFIPYGLSTDYERDYQGRYFGQRSSISVVSVQPVIGWQITDDLAIGGGPNWNSIKGELTQAIPNPGSPGINDIRADVEGDTTAWGYTLGTLYKPLPGLALGLTYHSRIKSKIEGDTDVVVPNIGVISYDASIDMVLPDSWNASVSYAIRSDWVIHASIKRTGWQYFDELRIDNSSGPTNIEPENWRDTYLYAVGVTHTLNDIWTIRAGVAQDESPIPNATRSVRLPADDRRIYGIGSRVKLGVKWSADFAYAYVDQRSAQVKQSSGALSYTARYDTSISNVRAQLNWAF